ncbi:hypothetical protein Tco_0451630 [Tanacetum coccineum]
MNVRTASGLDLCLLLCGKEIVKDLILMKASYHKAASDSETGIQRREFNGKDGVVRIRPPVSHLQKFMCCLGKEQEPFLSWLIPKEHLEKISWNGLMQKKFRKAIKD